MKRLKNYLLAMVAICSLAMTSCLNILEDVTFKKDGSGTYKMSIDMSAMKSTMEMLKGMNAGAEADSAAIANGEAPPPDGGEADGSMAQMGEQLAGGIKATISDIPGISNVVETQDTATLLFGYSFDFANVDALNKAIKTITKDKYDSKADEVYKFSGKKFERLPVANIGELIKSAFSDAGDESEEGGNMDMMKSFMADMTYKQVYHFPDRTIKSSSNELSELTSDKHSLTILLKPFDEEQATKKASVVTQVKLK